MLILSQISVLGVQALLFPGLGRVSEPLFHSLLHSVPDGLTAGAELPKGSEVPAHLLLRGLLHPDTAARWLQVQ